MPQVPYSGVPQVAPQLDPTPRYQAEVRPESFGVNVANAVQGMGRTVDTAGTEMFQRGLAMQDLFNHSKSQEADAQYMEVAGKIHADYSAKMGSDAVEGNPQFIKDLQDARKKIRDGLPNDMARKYFDSESLSTMGRTIFNGAGHAGAENKKYAISSNESQTKQQIDLAATSNNPTDVAAAHQRISALSKQRSELLGLDPATAEEYERTINSSLDFNTIKHIAQTEPLEAQKMLEERGSRMTKEDFDRAQTTVQNANRAVGSVNIAQKVLNSHIDDEGKADVSFSVMASEAEAEAKRQSPDDAVMQKHTVDSLRGLYNQRIYADKQFRWDNVQTVDAGIQNGVRDVQQLRADPKVAAAIDALPKSEQLKIPGKINLYNAARDRADNQQALTMLTGLRNNDVEAFLNVDPTDPRFKLSQQQQREVMGWQAQDKKNQNSDPRVNRALETLRMARGGELQALGVYHRDAHHPEDYDHMTGTLQSAIDLWQQSHGKPPTQDDIVNKIGPQVIQSRPVPGTWWGTNQEPFFKPDYNSPSYKNFVTQATKDIADREGAPPTPEQLDRAYTRMQLMKLYPPKSKSNANTQ